MPSFYFDTDDRILAIRDEDGVNLASVDDVPEEAVALLRDLANVGSLLDRPAISAVVRDVTGEPVYQATLTVAAEKTR